MIRQYRAGRYRTTNTPRGPMNVGTVNIGDVLLVRGRKVRVLAWLNREYASYVRGKFATKMITGGHLALVQTLHNGNTFPLSDCWLIDAPEVL